MLTLTSGVRRKSIMALIHCQAEEALVLGCEVFGRVIRRRCWDWFSDCYWGV